MPTGTAVKQIDNKLRVSAMPYLYDIAEGNVSGHTPWSKIGFNPSITTTEEDIWSAGGSYVFPTGATAMAVIGGATDDGSPAIFSGTSTSGSLTTLTDTGKTFNAGATAAIGDCVILDKAGTTPEWGYITGVSANTLTIAGGFSSGGTGSGRTYDVVDKALSVGAQAVKIEYLDTAYVTKSEIVILNGAAEVNLTGQPFRINSFRVIAQEVLTLHLQQD